MIELNSWRCRVRYGAFTRRSGAKNCLDYVELVDDVLQPD